MEKQPRLQPHTNTWQDASRVALAQVKAEEYRAARNPYIKIHEQKLGQLSLVGPEESDEFLSENLRDNSA